MSSFWVYDELPPPPEGFSARRARPEDAASVERLANACTMAEVGLLAYREGELAELWVDRDASEEHLVVVDGSGDIAAVVWTEPDEDGAFFELLVRPGDDRPLPYLVDAAEGAAGAAARRRSKDFKMTVNVSSDVSRALLDGRGYARGMQDIAMFMDLDGAVFEPRWPERAKLRAYRPGADDDLMYETMRAGFGEDWDDERAGPVWVRAHQEAPGYAPDLWFFAEQDGRVTGAIQCRACWRGSTDTGWVKNVAVLPDARGSGTGRALMMESFRRFAERGRRRAVLGVVADNPTHAKDFYLRIGMYEGGGSTDHERIVSPRG